jgi:hypothetical protein
MSEKFLNMQFIYKGKIIDVAKYKRDFKNKFYIGSDKNLLWQILNPSFPKKYLLLTKIGNNYAFSLNNKMKIEVNKDGRTLTTDELRRAKLITGNKLILSPNTTGRVNILNDWEIEYKFETPYRRVLSSMERAIISKYRRYESLDRNTKFTGLFLILSLIITITGLRIFEHNYKPISIKVKTIQQELQASKTHISKINLPKPKVEKKVSKVYEPVAEGAVGKQKAKTEKAAKQMVKKRSQNLNKQLKNFLGSDIDLNDSGDINTTENEIYQVATLSAIKSKSTKSLIGHSTAATSNTVDLSKEFADTGGNDLNQTVGSLSDIADEKIDLSTEDFQDVKGTLIAKKSNLKVVSVTNTKQLQKIKSKYAFASQIKESEIALNTTDTGTHEAAINIDNSINSYKSRIRTLYNEYNWKTKMFGTLAIRLFINANGKIDAVEISKTSGSKFSDAFIADVEKEVKTWTINVNEMTDYTFHMSFSSQ